MGDVAIVVSVIAAVLFAFVGIMQFAEQQSSENQEEQFRKKFAGLGDMNGMTLAEITATVGADPTSVTSQGNGTTPYQWIIGGTHIAIVFQDDVFVGVAHESYV